jgi:hypothetical protein
MLRPALLCVVVLALGCNAGGLAVGVPFLEVPDEVTFVDAVIGEDNFLEVRIRNSGSAHAEVRLRPTDPFSVPSVRVPVPPQSTVQPLLVFKPTSYAPSTSTLVIETGADTIDVPVYGEVTRDADADGFEALEAGGDDCDDADPDVFPGQGC